MSTPTVQCNVDCVNVQICGGGGGGGGGVCVCMWGVCVGVTFCRIEHSTSLLSTHSTASSLSILLQCTRLTEIMLAPGNTNTGL